MLQIGFKRHSNADGGKGVHIPAEAQLAQRFPIDVEGVSAGRQCRASCEIAYSLTFFVDRVVPQCYCDLFVSPYCISTSRLWLGMFEYDL